MNLKFITKALLFDVDILENISDECIAILLMNSKEADFWIEICKISDTNKFVFSVGADFGFRTNDLIEAYTYLINLVADNE